MDKFEILTSIKLFQDELTSILKDVNSFKGKQIQSKIILGGLEKAATVWFSEMELVLKNTIRIEENILQKYNRNFDILLEIYVGRPSSETVKAPLKEILKYFHKDIIIPIQKFHSELLKFPSLEKLLDNMNVMEKNYFKEALDCFQMGLNRAAIILGWCAAVSRMHSIIEKKGFEVFNAASRRIHAMNTGRYKKFDKKFEIQNLADLRMSVFDNDLMWVLESMELIDGNQHERLGICFIMRNTSAHPGEAIISDTNVLSFFSDLDSNIFSNPKFKLD